MAEFPEENMSGYGQPPMGRGTPMGRGMIQHQVQIPPSGLGIPFTTQQQVGQPQGGQQPQPFSFSTGLGTQLNPVYYPNYLSMAQGEQLQAPQGQIPAGQMDTSFASGRIVSMPPPKTPNALSTARELSLTRASLLTPRPNVSRGMPFSQMFPTPTLADLGPAINDEEAFAIMGRIYEEDQAQRAAAAQARVAPTLPQGSGPLGQSVGSSGPPISYVSLSVDDIERLVSAVGHARSWTSIVSIRLTTRK